MTIFMLVATPFLVSLFNISPQAAAMSVVFVQWFSLFYIPIAAYVTLACGLRASGDARSPMFFALIINVLIVGLTWWGTYGGWGLKPGGIRGAAIGMGMGNLIGILIAFSFWWRRKLRLTPAPIELKKQAKQFKRVWSLAYPAAMEQMIMQIGFLAFLWVVAHYGTAAYAAYGAGVSLLSLSMVIGYGFSIAGSILVGQQLGAGNIAGARQAGWSAMKLSLAFLVSLGLIIAAFAKPLAHWLVDDPIVAEHTITFIYILCIAQPFIAIDMALGGALRGAGDTRFPLIAALAGLIIVRFGLAILFMAMNLSLVWVFAAMIADYMVKDVFYIIRFRSGKWIKAISTHSPG
jgi:putative MATE family efflux protein